MKKSKQEQDLDYLFFLEKRLNSENFKNNVSEEEYNSTKDKFKKMKSRYKLLYGKSWK